MTLHKTSERGMPDDFESTEDFINHLRHCYAYEQGKSYLSPSDRVVELGCGEGYGSTILSPACDRVLAFDVDADTVRHAMEKYGGENREYRLYDGRTTQADDEQFEAAVSFQVIEHVEDDANFVSEAHRLLKKGGVFVVTTPNRLYRLKPGQTPWNTFHVREYDANGLALLLGNTFADVRVHGIKGDEEIQRIELDRVRRIRRLVSIDPLNVRRLLPMSLLRGFADFARKAMFGGSKALKPTAVAALSKQFSVGDFHIEDAPSTESLDLLAVCRK